MLKFMEWHNLNVQASPSSVHQWDYRTPNRVANTGSDRPAKILKSHHNPDMLFNRPGALMLVIYNMFIAALFEKLHLNYITLDMLLKDTCKIN